MCLLGESLPKGVLGDPPLAPGASQVCAEELKLVCAQPGRLRPRVPERTAQGAGCQLSKMVPRPQPRRHCARCPPCQGV